MTIFLAKRFFAFLVTLLVASLKILYAAGNPARWSGFNNSRILVLTRFAK